MCFWDNNKMEFDFSIKQEELAKIQDILKNPKQRKILIDGNIGAGKTTLIKLLEKYYNSNGIKTKAILEPVDVWRDTGALQYFYDNIPEHSYEFQTMTFITRIRRIMEEILKCPDAEVYLLERHIWSDRYIFAELLKEQFGVVRNKMYEMWWDMWSIMLPIEPREWVLLDTSVEIAFNRIAIRNRGEEKSGVSKEYLEQLFNKHQDFYKSLFDKNEKVKIVSSELMEKDFINNSNNLQIIAKFII